MTPAGNFFELWDLPRLHSGKPIRSLRLKNEGFWSLPSVQREYLGFMFSFCLRFFGILAKTCLCAQSNSVLTSVLGEKLRSTFVQSHKLEE